MGVWGPRPQRVQGRALAFLLLPDLKAPPDRLYGRRRGHALRGRQERLLAETLPRMRFAGTGDPGGAFAARPAAIWLEVGFGGGEHVQALAEAHADVGVIGCEVFAQGLCSLLAALVAEGAEATGALPGNLRIWDGDARALLRDLPAGSLDRLYLMFPDPWPKARHAKRRFVHPEIVALVASRMKPGAEWRAASDDPTYQAWVAEVIGAQDLFEVAVASSERPAGWPATRYEAKALAAGRVPIYWVFVRR
jgi:tRNA (guanine-N7-)-methyltransferase